MGKKSGSGAGQIPNDPPGAVPAPTGGGDAVPLNPAPAGDGRGYHSRIEFKFLEELKRRNVVRVALLYLVACWLILEPTHVVFHMLEVPAWANRLVLILMAIGFPAVLLFAWAFEITPEGFKPTVDVNPQKSIRSLMGQRLDRAIIVILVLALVYFVADKFWLTKHEATRENATSTPAPLASATIVAPEKSIAVLPFVNMSADKEQEYFSDGLSEELIDRLSHTKDLRVISRTSSFYFKGKQATIGEIANTLHVSHVLEGSVRKSGQALRITAQLIRTADGSHLWSQTYDRKLADVFKVQEEIAGTVATSLKAALTSTVRGQATSTNAEAYNLLLQGVYFWRRNNEADSYRAVEFFQRAIDLDPNYALAWARLADAYFGMAHFGWTHVADGSPKARAAADRALKLDPTLALAHRTLGALSMNFDWDWSAARAQFQLARDLDPDDLRAASDLAWLNGGMYGRLDERIEIERKMIEGDPLDTITRVFLLNDLLYAGRNEEAMASARQLVLLSPSAFGAHATMTYALLLLGRPDEALAAAQKEPDESWRLAALPVAYWALGRKAESDVALKELETKYALDAAYNIAQMRAYRGEIDSAFQWLDRAYRQHDAGMTAVRVDPLLQNLHKDQRYKATLVKMKVDGDPSEPLH